jgi:methionyl-tRNA formyltransferase
MRIALLGQAAFGADVLKGLLEHGHEVPGVFCPPDRGARPDPIKEAAGRRFSSRPIFGTLRLTRPWSP